MASLAYVPPALVIPLPYPVPVLCDSSPTSPPVTDVLSTWEKDIQAAARSWSRSAGGTSLDADDLAQESRLKLFLAASRPEGIPPKAVRKLIRNAMSNAIRDARRGGKFQQFPVDPDGRELEPASPKVEDAGVEDVRVRLRDLPVPLRVIYNAIYVQGRTGGGIAAVLGVSAARVSQLHAELKSKMSHKLRYLAA
jgi:RNA polymerase sigma factor (sigma-70 family)